MATKRTVPVDADMMPVHQSTKIEDLKERDGRGKQLFDMTSIKRKRNRMYSTLGLNFCAHLFRL